MKIIKNFLVSLFLVSFVFPLSAFCLSLQLTVEDVPSGVVSGASVSLIGLGSGFSGTTDSQGVVTIGNIPDGSICMVKVSKDGYVSTYWGPLRISSSDVNPNVGAVTESNPIFSQSFYTNIHASPAPSHTSGKADIVGMVQDTQENPLSGVVINATYLDTGQSIPSSQIKYLGNDMKPGNYSSTQSNGVFCIYNVDPGRPILITGTKSGYKFSQTITIGYPDSVTLSGIDQVDSYISISGYVTNEEDSRLGGANVSILGTSISTTTNQYGEFTLNNVPPKSDVIAKVSKTNYKDFYFIERLENQTATETELFTISSTFYNQVLPTQHISGKGDIIAVVETSGAVGKLYNYQGNEVDLSGKIYYWDDAQNKFIQSSSTASNGTFIILNLDPGIYFLRPLHDNIDFPSQCLAVLSDGITYAEFEVNPATVQGTISYTGTKTGPIYIGLFASSNPSGTPLYGTQISSPGTYTISGINPGTYYVYAYRDSNNNNSYDSSTDPAGSYSNSITLAAGETKTGIDITLQDPSGGGGGGGGGGCFIATAAFGSYQESHVWILRQFRDRYLLTNPIGSAFVRWYYAHSPKYAAMIAQNETLRKIARAGLVPFYGFAFLALKFGFILWLLVISSGVLLLRRKIALLRENSR